MSIVKTFTKVINKMEGILYVGGNGGSAAIANHFVCDLMKLRIPTISLVSNVPLITMISNDYGYSNLLDYQLKVLLKPEDKIFLISSSGNSENVYKIAMQYPDKILSLTGFDGGRLKFYSKLNYHVKLNDYYDVENAHQKFCHQIIRELEL